MRRADELIAAARATGTYDGYWGDGATIPWEQVPIPGDGLLLLYKQYVDARWPEAFRLHDWCYTRLGSLINVTRDEADQALREIIERDSPIDANIIYLACHLYGGQYFGTSLTGLIKRNIARKYKGVFKLAIKVVMIFKDATGQAGDTNQRIGGWSESVLAYGNDAGQIVDTLRNGSGAAPGLLPTRASLLPKSASIRAVRLYQGTVGKGRSFATVYPGNTNLETDIPQMALLCSCVNSVSGATRRWSVRCIPDVMVVRGEFSPTFQYTSLLNQYFLALNNYFYSTKLLAPASANLISLTVQPPVPPATSNVAVLNVTSTGGFTRDMMVRIANTTPTVGRPISASVRIIEVRPATSQIVIANWQYSNTTGGTVKQIGKENSAFEPANTSVQGVHTRKVGRPFDLFRGRRSNR